MPKFRMIHVDHYMCKPISPFDDLKSEVSGRPASKVPVIRIFGADAEGHKICLHVHGFYPYIALQASKVSTKTDTEESLSSTIKKLVEEIESALEIVVSENNRRQQNVSEAPQNPPPPPPPPQFIDDNDADSNLAARILQERRPITNLGADQKSPIHRVEKVKAYNYYGYHNEQEDFLKLYLYNPRMVKQLAQMFEDCRVFGRFLAVFWAHLPYILLFFIDNNLRGMQFIEVDQIFWRKNKAPKCSSQSARSNHSGRPPAQASSDEQQTSSNTARINEELDIELITTDIDPISTCELEADVRFEWIVNRQQFGSNGNDDALKELWLDDQEASQATSLVDSKLPLFELERNYIQQLCESCDLNYEAINLELTDRPKRAAGGETEIVYHDSDDDSLDGLRYREDLDEMANELSPEQTGSAQIVESPKALPSTSQADCQLKICDDEFSDDDEDFLRTMSEVVDRLKLKTESSDIKPIKTEPLVGAFKIEVKPTSSLSIKPKIEPDIKQVIESKTSKQNNEDDEFSDDDQFLMAAIIEAESQMRSGHKSQAADRSRPENVICNPCDTSLVRSHSAQQLTPLLSAKSKKARTEKRRFSDNSMIDGRSVVCSTVNQTRTGSQRSTSSSREIVSHEYQYLCLMSMELHITTRDQLRPDPAFDPIESVFYCIRNDTPEISNKPAQVLGMIITDPFQQNQAFVEAANIMNSAKSPSSRSNMSFAQKIRTLLQKTGLSFKDVELNIVESEIELIMALVEVVQLHDPEIMIGYEMEQLSWGYVLERASFLNLNIGLALSRIVDTKLGQNSKAVESTFVQPIMFTGRMVFSTWRIIKHEINLNTCSYERIHHHALNERVPCFSFQTLTEWFNQNRNRWRVIDYYFVRVIGQIRILDKFDLIAKVSELARVYGTQFIDVITRGSQIGIESMMLRLAKLQSLTPLSPTVMQRNKMKAPEALPLVMEPETNIYYDPVAVLDFQSLYPSVVIAYNYCYSTCLGRVSDLDTNERHQFGCSHLHVDQKEVKRLLESNSVHVSPCGVAFVKKDIRRGVLPKMLSELILTRAMVKDQMKKNMKSERPNRRLQRILNHRQHGLKMMANTTYGYTGASYTGRMPCVEIADSIVSKGRETLENAIELVESRAEWDAKVIYGDTDSIFIQFKGCDKDTAFKRAYEMVDAITAANPHPIKMKFEKIYQPCVLQTKKRYCGFKYESPEQSKPEFEAKGIETVRRDCCPAAARMLEMALRIQFTTRDINQVKSYVQHQFIKIMSGKLSNIMDFIFARQYKPRDLDKTESVFVPAWQITKRLLATDPRAEPRVGERVPFVIIYGEPRTPLVNLAKTPIEVLENISYRINADYYIQKIICPTLNRVFCTMKVDTLVWYKSMPHQNIIHRSHYLIAQKQQRFGGSMKKQSTMSQYFSPSHCPVCAKSIPLSDDICDDCRANLQSSVIRLTEEITRNQRKLFAYHQLCRACSSLERCDVRLSDGGDEHYNPCISYDCPNLFRYHQAKLDALNSNFLSQILKSLN